MLKQIAKQALEFLQVGVFKKPTSVRNDLGIAGLALEGTGSSTIICPDFFFSFPVQIEEKKNPKQTYFRESPVVLYTHSLPEILPVCLRTTINHFCRVKPLPL